MFAGIEAGGTKFVCGVGTGPDDLRFSSVPTTTPVETMARVGEYFRSAGSVTAAGIASFGPVDLDEGSPGFGSITATPKLPWRNFNLKQAVEEALGVPAAFDTDVNAAALAEWTWGAAQGIDDFVYLTVGTGIGGGAMVNGRLVHGLVHTEMGHIHVPHDWGRDPFAGACPYHGDCLEGLASGPAIEKRWGIGGDALGPDHAAWGLEAEYLALAVANFACTLSPKVVIMGGGVMSNGEVLPRVRRRVRELLNGYICAPVIDSDEYVVAPGLGGRSGVLGALALAARAGSGSVA